MQQRRVPEFHVSVDGATLTYEDGSQILNTGGVDTGAKACGDLNETRDWSEIAPIIP